MSDIDIFKEVMGFSPTDEMKQSEKPQEIKTSSAGNEEDIFKEIMGFSPVKSSEVPKEEKIDLSVEPLPTETSVATEPPEMKSKEITTPEITSESSPSTMEFTEPTEVKPSEIAEPYVPPSPAPAYGSFGVPMAAPPAIGLPEKAAAYAHRALAAGKQLLSPEVAKTAILQPTQEKKTEQAKKAIELSKESAIHGKAAEFLDPTWYTSEKIRDRIDQIRGQDPNLANSFEMGDIITGAQIAVANAFMSGDENAKRIALDTERQAKEASTEFEEKRNDRKGFTGKAENVLESVAGMLPTMGKSAAQSAIPVVGPLISTSMWAKQGAGDIITQLKEKGVPDDTALAYGLAGGLAYSLVEQVQVGQVLNSGVKKAIGDTVKKKIFKIAKEKGKDWFKEVGEEVIQGLITENSIISALKDSGIDVDSKEIKDRYKNAIKENFTGSAWPMAVLSAVGLAGGAARVSYAERGKPRINETVDELTDEVKPVEEEETQIIQGSIPETAPKAIPETASEKEYATLADYNMDIEEFKSLPEDVQYDIAKELSPQEREKILAEEMSAEQIQKPKEAEVGLQRETETETEIKTADLPGVEAVTEPAAEQPVPAAEIKKEENEIKKAVESIPRDDETEKKEIAQVNVVPSEDQKNAGNYRKAHIKRDGLEISIENPAGSQRSGTNSSGKEWSQKINQDYGYIRGTKGADAFRDAESTDQVDVFIKPNSTEGGPVYIINQVDPISGKFDEHKVMMGFDSQKEAEKAYLSNYEKGWKGLGSTVEMPMDEFKKWVKTDATKQPVKQKEIANAKKTGETIRETSQQEGLKRREKGRIRVRDDEENRVETGAGKEIKTPKGVSAKSITLPKAVNEKSPNYEPVLNLNKKPTGWLRPRNNPSVIVNPTTKQQITFVADNPDAATAPALTRTAASGHAINNPVITKESAATKSATETVRKRLGLEAEVEPEEKKPILKEKEVEPISKTDREALVSPAIVTESEAPAAKEIEKKKGITGEEKPVRQRLEAQQKRGRTVRAKSRRPASVKRVAEEKEYTPQYWKAQHGHHLNVEVYNALRDGWTDRAQIDHPGRQKGWVDDYNIITDSKVPGGTKNPTLSNNAKQWLQEVVDNIAENPDYVQELNNIGIDQPEHIDDVIALLQGSMSAAEFTRFHNDFEKNIREADVDLDQYDEALLIFNEEPINLTPKQKEVLEKAWGSTVENVVAAEKKELKSDDWKQQDLFGKEKSVAQLEAEEKARSGKEEITRKTEERKGGEPSVAGLPMFEDQDIEGSQQTIKFEKKEKLKEKPKTDDEYDIIDGSGAITKGYSGPHSIEDMGLSREQKTEENKKAISKHEISNKLGELSNTPIRIGRYRKKGLGIFKVRPREIRVSEAGNIPVVAHEVGHSLERDVLEDMQFDIDRWPKMRKELSILGKALYGINRPANGYISEGWAEYWKYYFTKGSDIEKLAPVTNDYVQNVFFKDNPDFNKKIEEIKDLVNKYKLQGSIERAASQIEPAKKESIIKRTVEALSKENFVEEAAGIEAAVKRMNAIKSKNIQVYEERIKKLENWKEKALKQKPYEKDRILKKYDTLHKYYHKAIDENQIELSTAKDPFKAVQALRRTAPSIVKYMAERGMLDFNRRVSGRPLSDAASLVSKYRNGKKSFNIYLYARRAQEYHRLGLEPGLSLNDANYTVEKMEESYPDFPIAAKIVNDWNRGVLDYANQAGAIPDNVVAKIKEKWDFYFPFERAFPSKSKGIKIGKGKSKIVYKSKGSGLPIRDPFETMLKEAERVIDATHQRYILDRLFELKDVEGIGEIMVEVPKDMVPNTFTIGQIESQLKNSGIDLSDVDLKKMITTFTSTQWTPNKEPIIAKVENVGGKEKIKWYYVDEKLYDAINGMNKVNTLGPIVDFFFGKPARLFKMGTTGVRASFSLSNAMKDFGVALIQSSGKKDPKIILDYAANTIKSDFNRLLEIGGRKQSEFNDLFDRLGLPMSQSLGIDIKHTRRATKDLFRGKIEKIIKNPVDALRDVIQITEGGPRVAAIMKMAKERGIDINNMTTDQMFDLIIEGSQVTTDFRAVGKTIRNLNLITPFINANIQGKRQFIRTWKKNPATAVAIGIVAMTLPSLINWFRNKDEEWYKELPDFEKYLYENVGIGDNVLRIPRAHEWGLVFQTIPTMMVDAAYQKDPESVLELFRNIISSEAPQITPHSIQIIKEQLQNKVDFTQRPIVAKGDVDNPGPEQYGPYTSNISIGIANMFKQLNWSPDRIDHIIRNAFGGVGQDILSVTRNEKSTGKELASLPVVGRFFRWGGKYTFRNKNSDEFYDLYEKYKTLANSKEYKDNISVKSILKEIMNANKELKIYRAAYKMAESKKDRQRIAKTTTDALGAFVERIKIKEDSLK